MLWILHQAHKTINELHQKEEDMSKELQHTLRFVRDKFTSEVIFFLAVSSSRSPGTQKLIPFELFKSQIDANCAQFIGSSFFLSAPLFCFCHE